jgi:hypothetical protein
VPEPQPRPRIRRPEASGAHRTPVDLIDPNPFASYPNQSLSRKHAFQQVPRNLLPGTDVTEKVKEALKHSQ